MDIIHAEVFQRFYSDNLLTQELPSLEKLTIKHLLVGRRVLAAIGDALQTRLLSEPALRPRQLFFFAAPLISRHSLENAVHKVLPNLSTKAIKSLISSFIFGGSNVKERDLWSLGIYNNLEEIRTACNQAARKAKAVVECIEEVLELTSFGPKGHTENWKVVPFVVSNQAIGVGSSFDDVPVVDRMILESYLGRGGYFPTARLGPGGAIADKGPFVSYYDDDTQAEERVEEYLRNPPAVHRYEQFCEPCRIPFEPFDDQLIVEKVQLNLAKLNSTIIETSG